MIGQGTAAVACQGIAELIRSLVGEQIIVLAQPRQRVLRMAVATRYEWYLCTRGEPVRNDDRHQQERRPRPANGARTILSIVNRRDSDLATKSHGVLYTSDGRDVEMAVASTKAFYAQVAAGCLLGIVLARDLEALPPSGSQVCSPPCNKFPTACELSIDWRPSWRRSPPR